MTDMRDELKKLIIDRVTERQGCKAMELMGDGKLMKFLDSYGPGLPSKEFMAALSELIEDEQLIEIEYTIPALPWRAKSFLLPGGSSATIVDAKKLRMEKALT